MLKETNSPHFPGYPNIEDIPATYANAVFGQLASLMLLLGHHMYASFI